MSKGSKPRPTDADKFADNHDAIFGKKKKASKKVKKEPVAEEELVPQWVRDAWARQAVLDVKRKAEANQPSKLMQGLNSVR